MKKFGFPKKEKLTNVSRIKNIFDKGKPLISSDLFLKALYIYSKGENSGVRVLFAVPKKSGNAVFRNRIKRILRESYRLAKSKLIEFSSINKLNINLIFSPTNRVLRLNRKLNRQTFDVPMNELINKLISDIK